MSDFYDFDLAAAYDELGDELAPSILKKGDYELEVVRADAGHTQKGDPKLSIMLEVVSGPDAGFKLFDNLNWIAIKNDGTENTWGLNQTRRALAMLGATPEWIRNNRAQWPDVAEHIVGARVLAAVTESEWNGEPQNRIRYKKAISGGTSEQLAQAPSLGGAQAPQQPQAQAAQPQQQAPQGQWPTL